jgi:hypothetical protein
LPISSLIYFLPSIATADDGSNNLSFAIPLIISFLTIFPFLYYSQALKPKERTVKQIEIDPITLKPIDKAFESKGNVDKAQAKKKK